MHVYIREQKTVLEMRPVDAEGLVSADAGLTAVAFYAQGNERPSFRALLPPETVALLEQVLSEPVQLALLAEEPEQPGDEVQAMVGLSVPVQGIAPVEGAADEAEPWRATAGDPEAWRGGSDDEADADADEPGDEEADGLRTALLAFAPLVRLERRFPLDFGAELADLLESALSGETRPSLQARVDQMLGGL